MDDPTRPHTPGRPATGPVSGPVVPPDTSVPLDTLTIHAGDGQPPLVTLNLSSGEMTFGPGYTPDAAAEAFWDAIRTQARDAARLDDPMTAETDRAISDFGPPARSAARKDPRYAAALEQVRKMAWPWGKPMVPGGWAETLAKDVLAAIRREEGHHRRIAHHAYEGPGPCRATYFGFGACGYPRAEHEITNDAGAGNGKGQPA